MTKILLVEDDKSLQEIYGVRLGSEGYTMLIAGDGEEALNIALKEKPDLILSDVMMPKISGFDMLDILRSTPEIKDTKVIIMTALSSDDQRERGESLGADLYLVKSQVGIEDVVQAVQDLLSGKVLNSTEQTPEVTSDDAVETNNSSINTESIGTTTVETPLSNSPAESTPSQTVPMDQPEQSPQLTPAETTGVQSAPAAQAPTSFSSDSQFSDQIANQPNASMSATQIPVTQTAPTAQSLTPEAEVSSNTSDAINQSATVNSQPSGIATPTYSTEGIDFHSQGRQPSSLRDVIPPRELDEH